MTARARPRARHNYAESMSANEPDDVAQAPESTHATPSTPSSAPLTTARGSRAGRRIMFGAGIVVFLIGVAVTIITPDTIVLGLALLGAGVILVSLSGAQRPGARRQGPEQRGPEQQGADQQGAGDSAVDHPERTT